MPFLLVEYLAALATAPEGGADEAWPLPAGAQALIRARVDALGEVGRQVLAAAAVLGRSFDADTLRATAGRSDEETVAGLEELVARGLVGEEPWGAAFGHEKVRALVYDDTGAARRRLLHRRAAAALAQPGPDREDRTALVARHLERAGQADRGGAGHARAAGRARAVYANADALAHLRAALVLGHPDRPALLTAARGRPDAPGRLRRRGRQLRDGGRPRRRRRRSPASSGAWGRCTAGAASGPSPRRTCAPRWGRRPRRTGRRARGCTPS